MSLPQRESHFYKQFRCLYDININESGVNEMAATALSRPVYTEFWIRPDVNEKYTLDDKLLYVYLITNRHFMQHAIYQLTKRMMMMELNMPEERFNEAFDHLENKFKVIKYSEKTNEIAILDYYKYGLISRGSSLTSLFDNLGKKVEDLELLKDMYEYSLNILDEKKEFVYAMNKIKNFLIANHILEEETIVDVNKAGETTNNGYYDDNGIFHSYAGNEGLPF